MNRKVKFIKQVDNPDDDSDFIPIGTIGEFIEIVDDLWEIKVGCNIISVNPEDIEFVI